MLKSNISKKKSKDSKFNIKEKLYLYDHYGQVIGITDIFDLNNNEIKHFKETAEIVNYNLYTK